ncbi:peptidase inhibitor family I36 [Nonomuraea fuscirosea]|uniref:Peptidase inhibitor family I36 n=1 Tax=Nonomuraea fuscirosea TaxID=1291556 RepID=A0A2T0N3S1_9ACTN|nr:peptidase inhibitor family I36 protein [Nonomuraea fuscirosea]PRX66829.1 peptidase inhibitor family I36 [Nonomuraea fuscirosea]
MRSAMVRGAGAVALALACVTAAGPAAQAEASQAAAACVLDFCLYEHDAFTGAKEEYMFQAYGCYKVGSGMNNKASSMRNKTVARVQFYDSANCSGAYGYAAAPSSQDLDLTNNGFDNKTSSLKFVRP